MTWSGGQALFGYTNVMAAGQLIASYTPGSGSQVALNFQLRDWLGTLRAVTDSNGTVQEQCESLPFGNGETCVATTSYLFTGKERDSESGNDYFGARYYGSSMGRFMSPHWSASVEPVPYAILPNPQSLNLYNYVRDNPLAWLDLNGHSDKGLTCINSSTQDDSGYLVVNHFCFSLSELQTDTVTITPGNITAPPQSESSQLGLGSQKLVAKQNVLPPKPLDLSQPPNLPCLGKAAGNFAVHGGADAASLIPVEGTLASAGKIGLTLAATDWHDSTAASVTAVTTTAAVADTPAVTKAVATNVGKDAAEAIPVIGSGVAAGAIVYDGLSAGKKYVDCAEAAQ